MLNKRELLIASVSALLSATAVWAVSPGQKSLLGSSVFDWNKIPVKTSAVGSSRQFIKSPTKTLDMLECHVTTLDPGKTSHPPHQHPDEELLVIREGTVESLVNGTWTRLGPGSVIFQASNEPHSIRNAGTTPATYHVIRWVSPGMPGDLK